MSWQGEPGPDNPFYASSWPERTMWPEEQDGDERLSLVYGLCLSDKDKKAFKKAWIDALPKLQHLKWLKLWGHVNQAFFEAACQCLNLECLVLQWGTVSDLTPIAQLKNLKRLDMGNQPKIKEVAPLGQCTNLEQLRLCNVKQVTDYSPLAEAKALRCLLVHGDMWKRIKLPSLDTILALKQLDTLSIDSAGLPSIKPLVALKQLKGLGVTPSAHPLEERAWLDAHMPNTESNAFQVTAESDEPLLYGCKQCGSTAVTFLIDERTKTVCSACKQDQIQAHIERYETAKRQALDEIQAQA